jgi:hypothetical protein
LASRGEAGRDEDAKPDLITSIDVSRTSGSLRDASINTTVKNIGSGPSPESLCDVIFRNARPPRQVLKKVRQKIRELDPGDAYTFSFTIKTGFGMYESAPLPTPRSRSMRATKPITVRARCLRESRAQRVEASCTAGAMLVLKASH